MDFDEGTLCAACCTSIDPGLDRSFAIGDGSFLCHACAQRRGGEWDELRERWVSAPSVGDVPDERRPHP